MGTDFPNSEDASEDTVKVTEPFIALKPADRPIDRPAVSTDQTPAEVQCDRPQAVELNQPAEQPSTDQTPAVSHQVPRHFRSTDHTGQ